MKRILLTRPMPERVVEAARAHFDVEIRNDPVPLKTGQMRAALALYDGVMPTLGDMFSAEVFDGFENPRCKILANFGVGYEPYRRRGRARRRCVRDQYTGCGDRGDGGYRADTDADVGAACR